MNTLFNNKGQVNASNKAEALSELVRLAGILSGQPSNSGLTSQKTYSDEASEAMLKRALETTEGKIALGQSMANPIRRNLDYMGVGRKALVVDYLWCVA